MPRIARIKSEQSIYHIIVKSISEVNLFQNDEDKDKYLVYIKKYQEALGFRVYAFCLMDNHGHFLIDSNGADISRIMHGINQSYAQYFNRRYKRHGHLFQDRFKSIVVSTDRQFVTLSLYIHNNAKDLLGKIKSIESYKYSSLGIYLNRRKDIYGILDPSFLRNQFGLTLEKFISHYKYILTPEEDLPKLYSLHLMGDRSEYRSERKLLKRNVNTDFIIKTVSNHAGIKEPFLNIKYSHRNTEIKAVSVFLLRHFCNLKQSEICGIIGNITQSRVSALASQGIRFIMNGRKYEDVIRCITETCEVYSELEG